MGKNLFKVAVATPKDWESYKKLRLEAINGPEANMFGAQTAANDRIKSDEEWMDDLLPRNNKFTVLSWVDSDLIALSAAREKKEKGFWHVGSDYVKPEFRGGGVGKKMLAFRLET